MREKGQGVWEERSPAGELRDRLLGALHLHPSELAPTLWMALYFFLAMAAGSIIKSLQNALYLAELGFDWRLPALYIALALLSGLLVVLLRRLASYVSRFWLLLGTLVLFCSSFLGFWFWIPSGSSWTFLAFYLWGGVFTLLLPTLGWMLSYDLYTAQQARRVYGLLGTGGILGGAFGGFYTLLLAHFLDLQWLLFHLILLLAALVLMAWPLRRFQKVSRNGLASPPLTRGKSFRALAGAILADRYLRWLASLVLMAALTTTLIDLNYKWVLEERFADSSQAISRFFGGLLGVTYLLAALVQLLGAAPLLRRFGLAVSLLVLPAALLLGGGTALFLSLFWAVVLIKMLDGIFRSSLHRTSVELLYLPLSGPHTLTIKGMIDLVFFRLGDAAGAALFLFLSSWFWQPVAVGLAAVCLLSVLWVALGRRLIQAYVEALRRSLDVKPTRRARRIFELEEAVALKTLLQALDSPNPTKVHFALQQLILMNHDGESPFDIELEAEISGIYTRQTPEWLERISPLVAHPDPRVGAAALHLLMLYRPEPTRRRLRQEVRCESLPRQPYLHYLEHYVDEPSHYLDTRCVLGWCRSVTGPDQAALARLMGRTGNRAFLPVLRKWLDQSGGSQLCAVIEAVGAFADPQDRDRLLEFLTCPPCRRAARRALASFGDSIVPYLVEHLTRPQTDLAIKREIPLVLGRIRSQRARDALITSLYLPDALISFRALKGLNKIRVAEGRPYPQISLEPALQLWARQYYELLNLHLNLSGQRGPAWELLRKAVRERLSWSLEKIFRGLGLFFPREDAYVSYLAYLGEERDLQENAVELIDSHVKGDLRQTLLPIFTEPDQERLLHRGRWLFHLPLHLEVALSEALFLDDAWLKCCIIAAVGTERMDNLKKSVQQAAQDLNPLVRETALWVLQTWEESAASVTSADVDDH